MLVALLVAHRCLVSHVECGSATQPDQFEQSAASMSAAGLLDVQPKDLRFRGASLAQLAHCARLVRVLAGDMLATGAPVLDQQRCVLLRGCR